VRTGGEAAREQTPQRRRREERNRLGGRVVRCSCGGLEE
jgi:hypothetical protein